MPPFADPRWGLGRCHPPARPRPSTGRRDAPPGSGSATGLAHHGAASQLSRCVRTVHAGVRSSPGVQPNGWNSRWRRPPSSTFACFESAAGGVDRAIAASIGRTHAWVATRSQRAATGLILGVEGDVVRVLVERHRAGQSVQELATRIRAGRSLVRLIVDAWAVPAEDTSTVVRQLWTDGASWEQIAHEINRSKADGPAHRQTPQPSPAALSGRRRPQSRCSSTHPHHIRCPQDHACDGHLPSGRPWWWASTIDPWAARALRRCPECGARLVWLDTEASTAREQDG